MNLDVCLQNIEKVGKIFAIANRPLDVISRIHMYIHLVSLHSLHLQHSEVREQGAGSVH